MTRNSANTPLVHDEITKNSPTKAQLEKGTPKPVEHETEAEKAAHKTVAGEPHTNPAHGIEPSKLPRHAPEGTPGAVPSNSQAYPAAPGTPESRKVQTLPDKS